MGFISLAKFQPDSIPELIPLLFLAFCVALGSGRCGGPCPAGVEGKEVFGGAVELCSAAGGFGDFLAEADVVEAGFDIQNADALRVELAGPNGTDFFRVGEVGFYILAQRSFLRGERQD